METDEWWKRWIGNATNEMEINPKYHRLRLRRNRVRVLG
jgi:hypothetical protein